MASSTTHAASSILRRVHQGTHAAFPLSLATLRPYRRSTSRKVVMYIAWGSCPESSQCNTCGGALIKRLSDLSNFNNHSKAKYEDSKSSSSGSSTNSSSPSSGEDIQEAPGPITPGVRAGDGPPPTKKSPKPQPESERRVALNSSDNTEFDEESKEAQESPIYHFNPRLGKGVIGTGCEGEYHYIAYEFPSTIDARILEDIQAVYKIPPDMELHVPSPNDLPNNPLTGSSPTIQTPS
ncbi:hypothetical protein TIFTF001_045991 [Ficus carica]|uniref:Uncharacterized protein n=1 Tax=Ficus carica TaxID=3494 RepID=A0AA87Z5J2_FICCA|nr:hypothetical protein TIFTF001_045991 [Ficus carica]